MKKIIAIALTLMLVFSLSLTSFAAPATNGTITINGASDTTEYAVYQLLILETFSVADGAYDYTVNPDWAAFFDKAEVKAYVTVTENGFTWVASEADSVIAEFAKMALQYAKDNGIDPVQSTENDDMALTGTTGVFSNLELGWYLVDSSAGALCGLTTTNPDASVNAKNQVPTVDKQVQEDLSGMWGDTNTADIGQVVNFMTIIHTAAGAENYVLHDKMSDGLTFVQDLDNNRGVTEVKMITSAGVESTLTLGTDYTVKTDAFADDCDFEVVFSEDFIKTLKANDRLFVYYNALLNRYAEVGTTDGNPNESYLEYGEEHYTTHDSTNTYTFSIDIIKTDDSNRLIDGAEFRIYDALTGGNEIEVVVLKDADGNEILDADGKIQYRRAREDEDGVTIVVDGGKVTVIGFDNGVYYLEETKQPDGYNQLSERREFTIADKNLDSVFNGGIYSTGSGVHIVNRKGSMLPETGGMGTVLFISLGALVVLGAGVLLVTKKRMSMIAD